MDAHYGEGMTGTAGLDGMGGMHGSTGGGSSTNFDQGREMVRSQSGSGPSGFCISADGSKTQR